MFDIINTLLLLQHSTAHTVIIAFKYIVLDCFYFCIFCIQYPQCAHSLFQNITAIPSQLIETWDKNNYFRYVQYACQAMRGTVDLI